MIENKRTAIDRLDGLLESGEGEELIKLGRQAKRILEIGVYKGKSTCHLAFKTKGIIFSVDTFKGTPDPAYKDLDMSRAKKAFIQNINKFGFQDRVVLFEAKSEALFKVWSAEIDLLFIDGDHSLEGVEKDFRFSRFLVPGGKIAFHDYTNCPDVKKFVDRHVKESQGFVDAYQVNSLFVATKK